MRMFDKEMEAKPRKKPIARKTLGTIEEYKQWVEEEKVKQA